MKDLLQRYIQGDASDNEKQQLMEWLDESPENLKEFKAMRKLYDISLWNLSNQEKKTTHFHLSVKRIVFETIKIAAVITLAVFVTQNFFSSEKEVPTTMQTIHVPSGQRAEIRLSDGTQVWLNSKSTLKFPTHFGNKDRNVELDGEGYFTVKHDESAPFIVKTNKYDIQVLGTEFNVKAYSQSPSFETSLLKGSVEISSPLIANKIWLKPNEMLVANKQQIMIRQINNYNYFKWKEGLFCFENESVENLIEKLQLYYDITSVNFYRKIKS